MLFGGTVAAHAELIAVDPADGEVVDVAPTEVILTFSEPVSLTGGSVRVLDDDADDVSTGRRRRTRRSPPTLADGLADGTYTVVWEVVSVDSHRISGASVFHVGAATSEGLTGGDLEVGGDEAGWGVRAGAAVLSAIGYIGALVAAGTSPSRSTPTGGRRLRTLTSRAAVLGAVALVAAVPFRIARLGGGLDALRDNDVLDVCAARADRRVHGDHGESPCSSSPCSSTDGRRRGSASCSAVVALAGFSIEGHTRATQRRWAMVASDIVHLVAAAVWLGGIVALVVLSARRSTRGRWRNRPPVQRLRPHGRRRGRRDGRDDGLDHPADRRGADEHGLRLGTAPQGPLVVVVVGPRGVQPVPPRAGRRGP